MTTMLHCKYRLRRIVIPVWPFILFNWSYILWPRDFCGSILVEVGYHSFVKSTRRTLAVVVGNTAILATNCSKFGCAHIMDWQRIRVMIVFGASTIFIYNVVRQDGTLVGSRCWELTWLERYGVVADQITSRRKDEAAFFFFLTRCIFYVFAAFKPTLR